MASDQPRRRPPAEPAWQNPANSGNVPITRNRAVAVGLWNDSDFAASPHLTLVSADALRSGGLNFSGRDSLVFATTTRMIDGLD